MEMLSGSQRQLLNWTTCLCHKCLSIRPRVLCLKPLTLLLPHQPGATHLDLSIGNRIAQRLTPPLPPAHHQPPRPFLQARRMRVLWEARSITPTHLQKKPKRTSMRRRRADGEQMCRKRGGIGQNQHQLYAEM